MTSRNPADIPVDHISQSILLLRGQRVILDSHLAAIYGVTTGRLNEAVKRNVKRFPADFMFRVAATEYAVLISQFAIPTSVRGGRRATRRTRGSPREEAHDPRSCHHCHALGDPAAPQSAAFQAPPDRLHCRSRREADRRAPLIRFRSNRDVGPAPRIPCSTARIGRSPPPLGNRGHGAAGGAQASRSEIREGRGGAQCGAAPAPSAPWNCGSVKSSPNSF